MACLAGNVEEESLKWRILETVPDDTVDVYGKISHRLRKLSSLPERYRSINISIYTAVRNTQILLATPTPEPPTLASTVIPQATLQAIQLYLPFVQNVLTNLHAMPSQRLHSMLVAVAPGFKAAGHSLHALEAVLELARRDGALEKTAKNEWKLLQE